MTGMPDSLYLRLKMLGVKDVTYAVVYRLAEFCVTYSVPVGTDGELLAAYARWKVEQE